MSTTSVETSLSSLLPTLNANLPSELVHLATSLLAQSRTRITLKPNEEIARPYACAEIACNRLQSRLKLPSMHGRPPLPPKVYAKLLNLLDNGLQVKKPAKAKANGEKEIAGSVITPARGLSTSTRRGNGDGKAASRSAASTPVHTPSKKVAFRGNISARRPPGAGDAEEAPEWVMPLIRRLCAAFTTPLLPPHVYTGTCVVLKLAKLWPRSASGQEDLFRNTLTAMTIAIYFMVLTRVQIGKITPEVYFSRCEKALKIAADMKSENLGKDAVDDWIKKMNDNGWCRGQEWWNSVPEDIMETVESGGAAEDLGEDDDVIGSKRKRRTIMQRNHAEDDQEGLLLPGLGTMMQDAVNFLSEERTVDHLEWREGILQRIQQIEKGKGRAVSVR